MEKFHTLKCLQQEAVRRKTFQGWTKTSPSPTELAKCGFYYLHHSDYTQCFFCRGVVGCWDESDTPQAEHKRHFPNCPLLTSPDATGNIPMDSSPLSVLMDEFLNYKLEYHKPPFPKQTSNSGGDRTGSDGGMRLPQYATPKARQDTFTSARKGVFPDQVSMVNAGFFYSGVSDFVVCFHCGGGLFNWGPTVDPWAAHARAYSFCAFLALNTQHWRPQLRQVTVPRRSPQLSEREAHILMSAPVVKRLQRLGMEAGLVQGAFKEAVEERGVLPVSESEAMDLVSKWASKCQMDVDMSYNASRSPLVADFIGPRRHRNAGTQETPSLHFGLDGTAARSFTGHTEKGSSYLNSSADDFRESGFMPPVNQPHMYPATKIPSNAAQSHPSNKYRDMPQVENSFSFLRNFSPAESLFSVKKEQNDVEIMDFVSPRPFYEQTYAPRRSAQPSPLSYPFSRSPARQQGEQSATPALARLPPLEIRNQPDRRTPQRVDTLQEVGSRSQETAKSDRIHQLLSELQSLQAPPQQKHQQTQFHSYGSRRHRDGRQITQAEMEGLARKVMELRRRVQEMKQRNSCRSCLGGAPASVMVLPCRHLHLCRVCSAICLSCPTCHTPIRGTVLPIREGLFT